MAENESQDASTLVKEGNNADNEEDTLLDQSDCASNASPLKSVGFNLQTDVAEENDDEIDLEIDDALDEGYMGMECTLERGFSLNESAIAKDLRHERYSDVAVKYMPGTSLHRYKPSLKHFIPIRKSSTVRDEMPVDGAGLYSFITISWITNMMWKAYKTGLKDDDVPLCSKYDMCEYNTDRLEILWNAEVKKKGKDAASLQYVLWQFYRTRFLFGIVIFSLTIILGFIGPIAFMRFFISWLSSDEPLLVGLFWAGGLIISEFTRVTLFCLVWSINYRNGIRLRAACLGMLYRKLMKMSSLGNRSVGEYCLSRLTGYLRRKTITVTDERVRMMNELLNCVKLIKMYAWEKSFASTVSGIRSRERQLLEKSAYVQSLSLAMAPTVPIIAAIVTFLAHIGAGYDLTPAQGMTVIAYFLGQARSSFNMLRFSVRAIVEGNDSFDRIKRMLMMEELSPYRGNPKDSGVAIAFQDATLAWDAVSLPKEKRNTDSIKKKESSKKMTSQADQLLSQEVQLHRVEVLFGLNFTIKKGELVGVCGGVGAGKSSLISSALGHMRLQKGCVDLQGTCAYVGQQAWILNATLRDNILLDESFDAKRYYRVIHACSLSQDIETMPAGDMTEIGERGINLSGGQKQRVSLARAIYADRDVYLLDDPLSAVDAHVGSHLFQWVIKRALQGKTTIFVTHQLQYLPQCDRVLLIQDGRVAGFDLHAKLLEDSSEYATLYNSHMDSVEKEEYERDELSPPAVRRRQDSTMSTGSERNSIPDKLMDDIMQESLAEGKGIGQLISEEKQDKGDIPWSTYHSYIIACGGYVICTLVISTFLLNVGSTAFSSWWLSMWLSAGSGNTSVIVGNETMISDSIADNPDRHYYQIVYGSFILVILATSLIRGFSFMKTTLRASSQMHDQVFMKVFHSPMSFFDTTPSGRIINIFSRDMDEVDVRVPMTLEMFIQNIFLIASALLFVCLVFPYFLPILAVLAIIMMFIRNVFRVGIRDFKRLENISRSPLYSHISTTVNGLATINAYDKQPLFFKKFSVFFDENSCAIYLFNCAMRWLAVRLDLLALCVTSSTAMLALFLRGLVDPSFAGLALAYATQLSGIFQYTVRLSTETEARFTSVQRLDNCSKVLVSEAPSIIESKRPDPLWPKYGRISFKKVQMKYRPETPLVLKSISFHIDSMEKIGVVGRTGSGKSSLGTALFRLVELTAGSIRIDGIDISTVGLEDLRSRLSIIPQDPVLFIGTVRYNLDPFERHSDEEIWSALEQTYMKDRISCLNLGLSSCVVENGENFSVGERQLLCMARVLLRNSKILFLDEATAAIDAETDIKIQKTLKNAFKSCTMITIAHRLNTVMLCSRVMVLDDGKVMEFDTPRTLLANNSSMFSKMVAKSKASFIS
ncbi:multidrug resistance-associated protein 5-like isoform X4 [Portunus trituberculatus]|uniref:multidrug resistance-associated protein 5-like isoform X4 n=1 Tax=Portunus trituberculatus TaxID=210409 RepID=UPI001E1CD2C5|nr:multidrug resistance-associated protein 5-like isoform X4 [Portunus trituberculatus]